MQWMLLTTYVRSVFTSIMAFNIIIIMVYNFIESLFSSRVYWKLIQFFVLFSGFLFSISLVNGISGLWPSQWNLPCSFQNQKLKWVGGCGVYRITGNFYVGSCKFDEPPSYKPYSGGSYTTTWNGLIPGVGLLPRTTGYITHFLGCVGCGDQLGKLLGSCVGRLLVVVWGGCLLIVFNGLGMLL